MRKINTIVNVERSGEANDLAYVVIEINGERFAGVLEPIGKDD